jgi:hypothetical protein
MRDCADGCTCTGSAATSPQKVAASQPTLGAIRGERRADRQRQAAEQVRELVDEDTTLVIPYWEFAWTGYLTAGDTTLALFVAALSPSQPGT